MLKQALYFAHYDYPSVRNALSGIIFLGTPHLTSVDDDRWENWRLILKLGRKEISKNALCFQDIQLLAEVCEKFNGLNLAIPVLSVYENIGTKVRDAGPISRFRATGKLVSPLPKIAVCYSIKFN